MRVPKMIKIFAFEDSRKVAFGIWLFVSATYLLLHRFIDSNSWMICMGFSAGLVGGGTVTDQWLKTKGGSNASETSKS